jgi:hypothetical protein
MDSVIPGDGGCARIFDLGYPFIGGRDENFWKHDPNHGRSNRNWPFAGRGVLK